MNNKKKKTLAMSLALYSLLTSGCSVKEKLEQNITLNAIKTTINDIIQNKEDFLNKPIETPTPTIEITPKPTPNPYKVSQYVVDAFAYSSEELPILDEEGNEIGTLNKNQKFYIYTTNYNYDYIVLEDRTSGYKVSGHIINNIISDSHIETDDYFFIINDNVNAFDRDGNPLGEISKYQKVHRLSTNGIYDYVVTREGYEGYIPVDNICQLDNNYVEIDISEQMLDLYINNECLINTKVITGKPSSPTYEGCFNIYSKTMDEILSDEETYWSYVQYWMPFYGGIGLHDADWRSIEEFNDSTTYLWGGSHGCVNVPPYIASEIYNNVDVGTMVLVHK